MKKDFFQIDVKSSTRKEGGILPKIKDDKRFDDHDLLDVADPSPFAMHVRRKKQQRAQSLVGLPTALDISHIHIQNQTEIDAKASGLQTVGGGWVAPLKSNPNSGGRWKSSRVDHVLHPHSPTSQQRKSGDPQTAHPSTEHAPSSHHNHQQQHPQLQTEGNHVVLNVLRFTPRKVFDEREHTRQAGGKEQARASSSSATSRNRKKRNGASVTERTSFLGNGPKSFDGWQTVHAESDSWSRPSTSSSSMKWSNTHRSGHQQQQQAPYNSSPLFRRLQRETAADKASLTAIGSGLDLSDILPNRPASRSLSPPSPHSSPPDIRPFSSKEQSPPPPPPTAPAPPPLSLEAILAAHPLDNNANSKSSADKTSRVPSQPHSSRSTRSSARSGVPTIHPTEPSAVVTAAKQRENFVLEAWEPEGEGHQIQHVTGPSSAPPSQQNSARKPILGDLSTPTAETRSPSMNVHDSSMLFLGSLHSLSLPDSPYRGSIAGHSDAGSCADSIHHLTIDVNEPETKTAVDLITPQDLPTPTQIPPPPTVDPTADQPQEIVVVQQDEDDNSSNQSFSSLDPLSISNLDSFHEAVGTPTAHGREYPGLADDSGYAGQHGSSLLPMQPLGPQPFLAGAAIAKLQPFHVSFDRPPKINSLSHPRHSISATANNGNNNATTAFSAFRQPVAVPPPNLVLPVSSSVGMPDKAFIAPPPGASPIVISPRMAALPRPSTCPNPRFQMSNAPKNNGNNNSATSDRPSTTKIELPNAAARLPAGSPPHGPAPLPIPGLSGAAVRSRARWRTRQPPSYTMEEYMAMLQEQSSHLITSTKILEPTGRRKNNVRTHAKENGPDPLAPILYKLDRAESFSPKGTLAEGNAVERVRSNSAQSNKMSPTAAAAAVAQPHLSRPASSASTVVEVTNNWTPPVGQSHITVAVAPELPVFGAQVMAPSRPQSQTTTHNH